MPTPSNLHGHAARKQCLPTGLLSQEPNAKGVTSVPKNLVDAHFGTHLFRFAACVVGDATPTAVLVRHYFRRGRLVAETFTKNGIPATYRSLQVKTTSFRIVRLCYALVDGPPCLGICGADLVLIDSIRATRASHCASAWNTVNYVPWRTSREPIGAHV